MTQGNKYNVAEQSAPGLKKRGTFMKRRLTATLLLASIAALPLTGMPTSDLHAQSVDQPSQDMILSIGRSEIITMPEAMADVFIADETIADVQIKSQRQLYIFGKRGGETTVYASNAMGEVIWSANIRVGSNIGSIDEMLALAMPKAQVAVATMGDNTLLLTGTVAAPEDASEAERLVKAFVGDETNVITKLQTATPLQINLQVRFAEVSRSLVRGIGANLTSIDGSSGIQFGVSRGRDGFSPTFRPNQDIIDRNTGLITGNESALGMGQSVKVSIPNPDFLDGVEGAPPTIEVDGTSVSQLASNSTFALGARFLGLDLLGALDLGETQGLVTTLSSPNLTAISGETANFLAGGEFPIPISQGLGATAVEYKNYGVSLTYTPTVLANGRISMRVRPEISELSNQGAVTLNGFSIPALTTRYAETTIELGSGQSFMIAGLMSNNSQNTLEKTPGAGDVPILGNLFRSRAFRKGETELVIVVTPYLVKPVSDPSKIKLPTDGFREADAFQKVAGFKEHSSHSGSRGARPAATAINKQGAEAGIGDSASSAPGQDPNNPDQSKDKSQARRAETPAPGFSL